MNKCKKILPNFPTCENLGYNLHLDRHCFDVDPNLDWNQNGISDPDLDRHQRNADPQHCSFGSKKYLTLKLTVNSDLSCGLTWVIPPEQGTVKIIQIRNIQVNAY